MQRKIRLSSNTRDRFNWYLKEHLQTSLFPLPSTKSRITSKLIVSNYHIHLKKDSNMFKHIANIFIQTLRHLHSQARLETRLLIQLEYRRRYSWENYSVRRWRSCSKSNWVWESLLSRVSTFRSAIDDLGTSIRLWLDKHHSMENWKLAMLVQCWVCVCLVKGIFLDYVRESGKESLWGIGSKLRTSRLVDNNFLLNCRAKP